MRKGTLLTLGAALTVSMCTAIPVLADDTDYSGQVNTHALYVRAGSSKDDSIIGDLAEEDEVTISGVTENGWYQIQYGGETAYVYGEYIDIDDSDIPEIENTSYDSYEDDEDSESTSYDSSYEEADDDASDKYDEASYEDAETADEDADAASDEDNGAADADEASDEETDASEAQDSSADTAQASSWSGPVLNRSNGTVQGPSGKETYYNLNMNGVVNIMRGMGNNDEYWVREDGCKMLGDYIMCAANLSVHPRGSLVESSLGTCIVCDTGGFAYSNPNQLDIAVNW